MSKTNVDDCRKHIDKGIKGIDHISGVTTKEDVMDSDQLASKHGLTNKKITQMKTSNLAMF